MKTRSEVARFIEAQFDDFNYKCPLPKCSNFHYGRQDLRILMDFIYGGPPGDDADCIRTIDQYPHRKAP